MTPAQQSEMRRFTPEMWQILSRVEMSPDAQVAPWERRQSSGPRQTRRRRSLRENTGPANVRLFTSAIQKLKSEGCAVTENVEFNSCGSRTFSPVSIDARAPTLS